MSRKLWLLTFIAVLSLLLAACGEAAAPVVDPAVVQEPVVQEPVVAEPEVDEEVVVEEAVELIEEAMEVAAAGPEQLDPAFNAFIQGMERYGTISPEALNEMLGERAPFLLDLRSVEELQEKGWIEGAVNVPLLTLADNLDKLPSFDTSIVAYCGSGWRCTIAMPLLEALGWQEVLSLTGGSFGGWAEAGYPIVEGEPPQAVALHAAQPDEALVLAVREALARIPAGFGGITAEDLNMLLVEEPELVLIDVRTAAEVEEKGFLAADNITYIAIEEFVDRRSEWPADKDAQIVIYCGSGHRSTIAMPILASYGYTEVYSLKGGYGAWSAAGYPVAGAPEAPAANLDAAYETFLAGMQGYNSIQPDALNLMLAEDTPPFLLDVRETAELEANGYIPGAVHIPIRELADNLALLPSFDTTIVSYCGSGWRCVFASVALEALGWEDVLCLKGGSFSGWAEAGYAVAEGVPSEAQVLDVAKPDPALLAVIGDMLANIPEGYGVVTADALATALVENADLIVIDVRKEAEIAEDGVIDSENLVMIPIEAFIARQAEWPQDKEAPIVLVCGSGHRSTIAMAIMWSYGYEDVLSLRGGMGDWMSSGYPVGVVASR